MSTVTARGGGTGFSNELMEKIEDKTLNSRKHKYELWQRNENSFMFLENLCLRCNRNHTLINLLHLRILMTKRKIASAAPGAKFIHHVQFPTPSVASCSRPVQLWKLLSLITTAEIAPALSVPSAVPPAVTPVECIRLVQAFEERILEALITQWTEVRLTNHEPGKQSMAAATLEDAALDYAGPRS
uniref:Uncharacterized protein n=1 Tax=Syphacia muris TaxID=451379 RepID=A0A0N5ALQ8_9BILA